MLVYFCQQRHLKMRTVTLIDHHSLSVLPSRFVVVSLCFPFSLPIGPYFFSHTLFRMLAGTLDPALAVSRVFARSRARPRHSLALARA